MWLVAPSLTVIPVISPVLEVKPESLFKELIFILPNDVTPVPPLPTGNVPVTSAPKSIAFLVISCPDIVM